VDSSAFIARIREDFGKSEFDFDEPDVTKTAWGEYGDFQLVGNGEVTSPSCGKFRGFRGCLRTELHNIVTLDGRDFRNKVYVHPAFYSCDKPSCPICYKRGWAVREAENIELRLLEAKKRFGLIEHVMASVPKRDYGLKFETLRKKVVDILEARGVIGGALIFHAFRYEYDKRFWYWSPHFHVLGFILGGYSRCRGCRKPCGSCDGFEARTRRHFERDGYIVKVAEDEYGVSGQRVTVGGTAWYQLNHASIKKDVARFRVATWFGVCSYRKLKVTIERKKAVCPICLHDQEDLLYRGNKQFCLDRDSPDFKKEFMDELRDGENVLWDLKPKRAWSFSE
jgi:hypothetical protein